ncbi:MAG: OadG family transporter subunit [Enterocloster sp.]
MRRLMKRVAAVMLAAVCLMSLSACAGSSDEDAVVSEISMDGTPVDDAMAQSIILSAVQTLGISDEQLIVQKKLAEAQGDFSSADIYEKQKEVRAEMGEMRSVDVEGSSAVMLADGSYTVMIPVNFAEGTKQYVLNLNMATQQIKAEFTDMSAGEKEDTSIGGLLKTATVYSAIGIGTVFAVLVFISLLISCFKFIHEWEMGQAKKNAPAPAPAKAAPAPVKAAPAVTGPDLSDDAELVAVITAAIAAYEGTSSNGLVVRSIRRVQGSRRR